MGEREMNRTVIVALISLVAFSLAACNKQSGAAGAATTQSLSSSSQPQPVPSGTVQQAAALPSFVEGHPDKKPLIITGTVTKVRSVNDLDARMRLAVVRWVKPKTGETVSNVIVCQADRHDCMRLDVGGRYTMVWLQHGAIYDIYGLQGYQTVLLTTGCYAASYRGVDKACSTDEAANSIVTGYAVVELNKGGANNLREWAMSQ